jgi:hypothetical protein
MVHGPRWTWGPSRGGPAAAEFGPVVAIADPRRPGRSSRVVRVGRNRADDRVRGDSSAAGNLGLAAAGHGGDAADRGGGLCGVRPASVGSHPTCARRHGQPALILPAQAHHDGQISPHRPSRHKAAATPPARSPQPRTKFSGQRDRPGEKAKLIKLRSHTPRKDRAGEKALAASASGLVLGLAPSRLALGVQNRPASAATRLTTVAPRQRTRYCWDIDRSVQ